MKALKIAVLVILGLLLFTSLTAFGVAFTLNATLLNRDFLPNELDHLEIGPLLTDAVEMGASDIPSSIRDAALRAATKLEPEIKAQFRAANYQVYSYLLGQTNAINLRRVAKDTVLSKQLVASIENDADVLTLVRQSVRNELAKLIPAGQEQLVTYLDRAMPSLDPWIKQQMDLTTGPTVDYIVGDANALHVVISLDQMKSILRESARAAFLKSPPSQLTGATQSQLDAVFNQYYSQFAAQIPATVTVDPSTLGLSSSSSMAQAFSDAESGLAEARTGVSHFRLYFLLLLFVVLVLVAAIVLVHREVRGSLCDLGIVLLTYGIFEFIGVLIATYFLAQARFSGMPDTLHSWLPRFYWDIFRPLAILSGVLAFVGLGMLVGSGLYRRRGAS